MHDVVSHVERFASLSACLQEHSSTEAPQQSLLKEEDDASDVRHNATPVLVWKLDTVETIDCGVSTGLSHAWVLSADAGHDSIHDLDGTD